MRRRVGILLALALLAGAGLFAARHWRIGVLPKLITAAIEKDDPRQALFLSEQWVWLSPGAESYAARGRARWLGSRFDEAVADFQQATLLGWSPDAARIEQALMHSQAGGFLQAEPTLRAAIVAGLAPDTRVHAALVRGYANQYRLDQALHVLGEWIRCRPDDIRPYLLRPEIQGRITTDRDGMLADYVRVTQLAPEHFEAHLRAGQLAIDTGKLDVARAMLERCGQLDPGDARVHLALGRLDLRDGKAEEAETRFKRAMELDPDDSEILIERGKLSLSRGNVDESIQLLEKAVARPPADVGALYSLVLAYQNKGDISSADRVRAQHARITSAMDRCERLQRAVLEHPNDEKIIAGIIEVFVELERPVEAEPWVRRLESINPVHETVRRFREQSSRERVTPRLQSEGGAER